MKKVLIFGASGFVGKYLAEEMANHNYEVFGSGKGSSNTLNYDYYQADLLDEQKIFTIIKNTNPDIIINLAAFSSVGLSWNSPQETIRINVIGSLNILESVKKLNIKPKILFVGSSEEYVISDFPMNEDRMLNGNNPYGISKIMQEQFANIYRNQYGLKIFCVRSFNHTGIGQRDSFVLPSFCKQVVEIEKNGNSGTIYVGNLSIKRDFSHVKDIVRAYRLVVESENDKIIYNVGYGKVYKLEDMLKYIISKSTAKINIKIDRNRFRPVDQPIICCDNSLITSELGWTPKYTVFDALDDMLEYYRKK